jgi:poly-gamma-glutamate synthesis protein (capsule biosynthesis protein)
MTRPGAPPDGTPVGQDYSPTGEKNHFPFVYTEEADLPSYMHVRAEGQPLREAIRTGRGYIRKYRKGRWSTCAEGLRYFDDQRRLLRRLSGRQASGVRLGAVGDIMWLRDSWDRFLSPEVLEYLNEHDLVFGNLETPVSDRRYVYRVVPDTVHYNSKPSLITTFVRPDGTSTFTALSTANNHCLDKGDEGLEDTLAFLDSRGIAHSGTRAMGERPWTLLNVNGLRLGFYSSCWGLNAPHLLERTRMQIETIPGLVPVVQHPVNLGRIRDVLADMRGSGVEFRIVALHWGHEFEFYPTPDVMRVGREVVELGADLILGTHPHVVQPLEVCFVNGYESRLEGWGLNLPAMRHPTGCLLRDSTGIPRKALIVYSLGNFLTAMYTKHCRAGMIASLQLARDEAGRVDWHRPDLRLTYNSRELMLPGQRRLKFFEDMLRDRELRGRSVDKLRAFGRWLENHLLGPE